MKSPRLFDVSRIKRACILSIWFKLDFAFCACSRFFRGVVGGPYLFLLSDIPSSVMGQYRTDTDAVDRIGTSLIRVSPAPGVRMHPVQVEAHRHYASISPKAELKVHVFHQRGCKSINLEHICQIKYLFISTCVRSLFIQCAAARTDGDILWYSES